MDAQKYLIRIGCSEPCPPTLDTLRQIHLRHLLSVPFENLTIHSGGRVSLELPVIYDKIVLQRRGGFCYEMNGLFSWLLTELGYDVTLLSAQVKSRLTNFYGPPFDHFIMMVTVDGARWLCDVGFGNGFALPLSLETETPQPQAHYVYRLRHQEKTIFVERLSGTEGMTEGSNKDGSKSSEKAKGNIWTELYKFTLEPRQREDFKAMCEYHQTSPCSVFFCKTLCSLLLPNGRVTYMGRKLTVTSFSGEGGLQETKTTEVDDEDAPEMLRENFGIVLPSPHIPKDIDIEPPPVTY